MILERRIKPTLTPIELDAGDTLRLILSDGTVWEMTLGSTSAAVLERAAPAHSDASHYNDDIRVYGMTAVVTVNGHEHTLQRQVGNQASFYEPWVIHGVRLWFDAAACAFIHPPGKSGLLHEKDWRMGLICSPRRAARFAVQQADLAIAPEPIGAWYPGQPAVPDIRDCYMGEDCWMGPYAGGAAHCGLDINMPKGTVLTTPIALDHQYMFNDATGGSQCGRWRGIRRWDDGSQWVLQAHHVLEMIVPQRTALARGTPYATGAGTGVGLREHSHFMFQITEQGGEYWLDPWILFWAHANQRA